MGNYWFTPDSTVRRWTLAWGTPDYTTQDTPPAPFPQADISRGPYTWIRPAYKDEKDETHAESDPVSRKIDENLKSVFE